MKKEIFDSMMENIAKMITESEKIVGEMGKGLEYLESIPVGEYNKLCKSARTIQSNTDRIFKAELYHIIGMGNLTGQQMLKFTAAIKKLGSYRTAVKTFATSPDIKIAQISGESSEFTSAVLLNGLKLKAAGKTVEVCNE